MIIRLIQALRAERQSKKHPTQRN